MGKKYNEIKTFSFRFQYKEYVFIFYLLKKKTLLHNIRAKKTRKILNMNRY